jgi:hypothetical protein
MDTTHRLIPLRSMVANLPEMLLHHLVSDERIALIIEVSGDRYVQFLAREDQSMIVECISNRYLDDDHRLDLDDEMRLVDAGFTPPDLDDAGHPNWWWYSEDPTDVMTACRMGRCALEEILRVPSDELVTLIERRLVKT